ncbi:hypothetical protein FHG87_004011 [Trinorchestia longiramus]|nr:hypothetical protein FHG87_004011 [Trinorchestia longiramus]
MATSIWSVFDGNQHLVCVPWQPASGLCSMATSIWSVFDGNQHLVCVPWQPASGLCCMATSICVLSSLSRLPSINSLSRSLSLTLFFSHSLSLSSPHPRHAINSLSLTAFITDSLLSFPSLPPSIPPSLPPSLLPSLPPSLPPSRL